MSVLFANEVAAETADLQGPCKTSAVDADLDEVKANVENDVLDAENVGEATYANEVQSEPKPPQTDARPRSKPPRPKSNAKTSPNVVLSAGGPMAVLSR